MLYEVITKTSRFYVPLGVGGHLERWGVPRDKIVELALRRRPAHARQSLQEVDDFGGIMSYNFV